MPPATASRFDRRLVRLRSEHATLIDRPNSPIDEAGNGIYERWRHPVVTRDHAPLEWRFDLDPERNPHLMERIGVNSAFNAGAMLWRGRYLLVLRMESSDRKSWFAIAESDNGKDGFRFRDEPVCMPESDDAETNVYDMRLTAHEDGWIYGLFCAERHDDRRPDEPAAALARCGIARTRDLETWERLPDLVSEAAQQRNVVLHPEFVDGRYGLYTRPQDDFIEAGEQGGLSWASTASMDGARTGAETVIDRRAYHTVAEAKNGQGPPPLKTEAGWLHLAHGVRATAAGLRYVLYLFVTDLDEPWRIVHKPAGHFLAPRDGERVGDVPNVVFCNGWIRNEQDEIFIYYASADTRTHVATSTVDRLLDYSLNTPQDGLRSIASAESVRRMARLNRASMDKKKEDR